MIQDFHIYPHLPDLQTQTRQNCSRISGQLENKEKTSPNTTVISKIDFKQQLLPVPNILATGGTALNETHQMKHGG